MPIVLSGATSGSTTVQATDAVTATLTLPSSTGTLISTANPQSGSVIQVVNVPFTTSTSTTSTTYVTTGHTASITPRFATSKIQITVNGGGAYWGVNNTRDLNVTVYKNGTNLAGGSAALERLYMTNAQETLLAHSLSYTDSPNTTSSTTYTVYFLSGNGQSVFYLLTSGSGSINLVLTEIAA